MEFLHLAARVACPISLQCLLKFGAEPKWIDREKQQDAVFYRTDPLFYHKVGNMVFFRLYSLCSSGNQHYQKSIYFLIFFIKKVEIGDHSSIINV